MKKGGGETGLHQQEQGRYRERWDLGSGRGTVDGNTDSDKLRRDVPEKGV